MALSLKKGGTYAAPEKAPDKAAKPRFHFTPGSYNAQKGKLLLRISAVDFSSIDFHEISYPEENQTLKYAMNLSPNMSVPVLEIDGNVVINDSYDIHKYLIEHYPGKGNASLNEEQKSLQEKFIETNLQWDEYLFSYRRMPKLLGNAMHQIRLVELSKAIHQAVSDGLLDKKLMDGRTVQQAYIDKVAQTRSLIRIGCDNDTLEKLNSRIKANEQRMEAILKEADELLAIQEAKSGVSNSLLLTNEDDELTSADIYLAVLLMRISTVDPVLVKQILADYPRIEKWWTYFNTLEEAEILKGDAGPWKMVTMMLLTGKPIKFALYGVGLLTPKPLPNNFEEEVVKELENLMRNYCNT